MSKTQSFFVLLLTVLLVGRVEAQTPSADDPYASLARQVESAQTRWNAENKEFLDKFWDSKTCTPDYQELLVSLKAQMENVFRLQKEYYASWSDLIAKRISRDDADRKLIPLQRVHLEKDAENAKAAVMDARRRLEVLTTVGSPEAIRALKELIDVISKEEQETRSLLVALDAEFSQGLGQGSADKGLQATLTKRVSSLVHSQTSWTNLYKARLNRARLRCGTGLEGFK